MKVLGVLNKELNRLNIHNEFYEWTSKIPKKPYWVYEYIISDSNPENNQISGVILLNGFSRNGLLDLENDKDAIIKHFRNYTTITNGIGLSINSNDGQFMNTNDNELKRFEIKLNFNEWSVN